MAAADMQPLRIDMGFFPPGLPPPPGLAGLALGKTSGFGQAASTPGSISTAADSSAEDLRSTHSRSSDEGEATPKTEKQSQAFASDAAATIVGAVLGTSTTTTYIESAAGVEDGGKTGLVAMTVGVLMLSGLFFTDLFAAIPQYAMASALVIIGALMMRQAADVDWDNAEIALPAFLTIVLMPFTYSIADGIAWGIIAYCVIKIGMGKWNELNPVMWTLLVLMTMFYIGPGDGSTFEYVFGLIF
jgi:xanthine/uracil/vitamin C permease (AzgA family)